MPDEATEASREEVTHQGHPGRTWQNGGFNPGEPVGSGLSTPPSPTMSPPQNPCPSRSLSFPITEIRGLSQYPPHRTVFKDELEVRFSNPATALLGANPRETLARAHKKAAWGETGAGAGAGADRAGDCLINDAPKQECFIFNEVELMPGSPEGSTALPALFYSLLLIST